jgi:Domain of unknown function (DUF4349)
MTPSPDVIDELRASKPAAPRALRARVREIAAQAPPPKQSFWLRLGRPVRIAVPALVSLAIVGAGVVGLARSAGEIDDVFSKTGTSVESPGRDVASAIASEGLQPDRLSGATAAITPDTTRAQRVSATMTVEVPGSDGVSSAAQEALTLTRRLGGHVVSASVVTGEQGSAALTVRIPVARVQEAIAQLSALGRIVSQQVTIDDLQQTLDRLDRRQRSVRSQIALIVARLESESLDAETRARLEGRLKGLRDELRDLRRGTSTTNAEARMATIQMSVVTPTSEGVGPAPSRLDRTLDEALNVLVWEGVIALAIAIVAAPFALVALGVWLGRRLYRRREEDRLLAT